MMTDLVAAPPQVQDVFPDFLYSIDDEPTGDWTVEQLFQWTVLKSMAATELHGRQQIDALRGRKSNEVQQLIQLAVSSEDTDGDDDDDDNNNGAADGEENEQSGVIAKAGGKTTKKKKTKATTTAESEKSSNTLRVEVVDGPDLVGIVFELKPTPKNPCWLGRSRAKKFVNRGVSLHQDGEVSTNHGKFTVSQDKKTYYFVDAASTNGTKYICADACDNDRQQLDTDDSAHFVQLEPDVPFELHDGYVLLIGSTQLKITLPETANPTNDNEI